MRDTIPCGYAVIVRVWERGSRFSVVTGNFCLRIRLLS